MILCCYCYKSEGVSVESGLIPIGRLWAARGRPDLSNEIPAVVKALPLTAVILFRGS
jgi:hypothetical protein